MNVIKREWVLGIVAVLFSMLLTLALGELAVRIITSRTLVYNIEMVKYAKQLKIPDPDGVVSHVHKSSATANLMGVDISLNSLGHRGLELPPLDRQKSKRAFVLGSSVTMGWGVPYENVFTTLVEKKLNSEKPLGNFSIALANAGIGNYNTFAQYQLFLKQYPIVKPDLVILHYFISDVEPRSLGRNNPVLKYSYLAAFLFDRICNLFLMYNPRSDLFRYYASFYEEKNPDWIKTQSYIADIRNQLSRDNIPFLIMIIPDFHNLAENSPYAAIYQTIDSTFKKMSIPTINTFPIFSQKFGKKESELWIAPSDPHPNSTGHKLMGEILYDYLVKENPFKTGNR